MEFRFPRPPGSDGSGERRKEPDIAALRAAIDKAICHRSFLDYNRIPAYARGIDAVIDSLEALLERGHAKTVRELVERALQRMESAMDEVDDSDGYMGGLLDRLQQLHFAVCQVEKPEPAALAKFLFEWEISSGWEIFLGAAETYADVLGKAGLAEYRKRAEAKWAKVPPLLPGERDPEQYRGRWRIMHIMEALAKQAGDVEVLVAVNRVTCPRPSTFSKSLRFARRRTTRKRRCNGLSEARERFLSTRTAACESF